MGGAAGAPSLAPQDSKAGRDAEKRSPWRPDKAPERGVPPLAAQRRSLRAATKKASLRPAWSIN